MNDQPTPETPPYETEPASGAGTETTSTEGPGRLIREARERVQMSLDELSTKTRLPRSILAALEQDDFATLRDPVYVHGYYRKCCQFLTLSEATLLEAYQRMTGSARTAAPSKFLLVPDNTGFDSGPGRSMRWWWLLVLIVILLVVYWFLHGHTVSKPAVQSSAAVTLTPTHTTQQPKTEKHAAPLAQPSSPVSTVPASASTVAATATSPSNKTAAQTAVVATSEGQTGSTETTGDALVLTFAQNSWVRIKDSTGKLLLTGLVHAGTRRSLNGTPPYSVFLGYAPGVTVQYGGKTVDLKPETQSNSTARLSVPSN